MRLRGRATVNREGCGKAIQSVIQFRRLGELLDPAMVRQLVCFPGLDHPDESQKVQKLNSLSNRSRKTGNLARKLVWAIYLLLIHSLTNTVFGSRQHDDAANGPSVSSLLCFVGGFIMLCIHSAAAAAECLRGSRDATWPVVPSFKTAITRVIQYSSQCSSFARQSVTWWQIGFNRKHAAAAARLPHGRIFSFYED